MPVAGGPFIQKTGILLEVDSADKTSYSGTGTTWINQIRPGTYNGTLNNISFDSADAKGALVFTGSNTFVDFGNLGPSLTSSFSFQVAFEPAATASGQPYTILSYASASSTSSITFKLDYTSSNQTVVLTTFSNTGSQNIVYAMSASVASGSWNIVHGTFGTQLAALYVNGLGQVYTPTTGSVVGYNASNRLYAGLNYGSTSGYYSGSLANITVNNADLGGLDINRNYNAIASRFGLVKRNPIVTDADAFAFVEVAGIVDPTQQAAVNSLVLGLKANNLWTKMQAIYPFVGGTAYTHKFNLKDPRDSDAAFRIQYVGALNHFSTGVLTAGGYMNTFFDSTDITPPSSSFHYSAYTYTTGSATNNMIFNNSVGSFQDISFTPRYAGGSGYFSLFQPVTTFDNSTGDNSVGYSIVSRLDTTKSTLYRYWANGNYVQDNTNAFSRTSNFSFDILRSVSYSNYNGIINFVTFGAGLTSTESTNLNTLIRNYNLALSRNVV
jgi:hypothetical protein